MTLTLDDFAIRQVFDRIKDEDGNPVYYRTTTTKDSWLIVWPDGETLHTYHRPWDIGDFTIWHWDS